MTRPQLISFGREICGQLHQAERREWWLANGLGGYAAGNIAGTLNRRYHGLLIAPLELPLGRSLVFAKADARLEVDGNSYPLFSNRWCDNIIDPQGFAILSHSVWMDVCRSGDLPLANSNLSFVSGLSLALIPFILPIALISPSTMATR